MDKKKIAKKLIVLRNGKNVADVANAIGITASALSNYEQGYRIPRDEIKIKIAKYYKTTVEHIFFE